MLTTWSYIIRRVLPAAVQLIPHFNLTLNSKSLRVIWVKVPWLGIFLSVEIPSGCLLAVDHYLPAGVLIEVGDVVGDIDDIGISVELVVFSLLVDDRLLYYWFGGNYWVGLL